MILLPKIQVLLYPHTCTIVLYTCLLYIVHSKNICIFHFDKYVDMRRRKRNR